MAAWIAWAVGLTDEDEGSGGAVPALAEAEPAAGLAGSGDAAADEESPGDWISK